MARRVQFFKRNSETPDSLRLRFPYTECAMLHRIKRIEVRRFHAAIVRGGSAWLLCCGISGLAQEATALDTPWAAVPGILKRIVPPQFPARDFVVTKFGAVADGETSSSKAFRDAIGACAAAARKEVPHNTHHRIHLQATGIHLSTEYSATTDILAVFRAVGVDLKLLATDYPRLHNILHRKET